MSMLKVTVDLEAAKEFISRYFSGKGTRVDLVEILDIPWGGSTITTGGYTDLTLGISKKQPLTCQCGCTVLRNVHVYPNGGYSFTCGQCGMIKYFNVPLDTNPPIEPDPKLMRKDY